MCGAAAALCSLRARSSHTTCKHTSKVKISKSKSIRYENFKLTHQFYEDFLNGALEMVEGIKDDRS